MKHIFEEIDEDGNGTIDFHEFIEVMQVQWKGVDLGKAVKIIKAQEEAEKKKGEVDYAPVEALHAEIFGIKLPLRVFGAGMNAFLLVRFAMPSASWCGLTRFVYLVYAVFLRHRFTSRIILSAVARPV